MNELVNERISEGMAEKIDEWWMNQSLNEKMNWWMIPLIWNPLLG